MKRLCPVYRNYAVGVHDLLITHHLPYMKTHEDHVTKTAVSHRIPRIEDVVMAKGNIDARFKKFLDPGHTSSFRIGVGPALQMGVDQRIGHKIDPAHLQ